MNKNEPYIYESIDLCTCYEPFIKPSPEQLEEWRMYWYNQSPAPTLDNTSFYAIELDGTEYYYCGNTRIKVSEHFADNGKTMNELIENTVRYVGKTRISA